MKDLQLSETCDTLRVMSATTKYMITMTNETRTSMTHYFTGKHDPVEATDHRQENAKTFTSPEAANRAFRLWCGLDVSEASTRYWTYRIERVR